MVDHIEKLFRAVESERNGRPDENATAKLIDGGRTKIAKKVVEEAAEVSLAFAADDREEIVRETVDLFYNLVVLLSESGLTPQEIWDEMDRREALMGLAGKLPKNA